MATVGPGDEVIVPAPFWVSYLEMVKLAGRPRSSSRPPPRTASSLPPPSSRPRSRRAPSSSSSTALEPHRRRSTKAEMEAFVGVVLKHGLYLMSDEMYEHLTYDGRNTSVPPPSRPRPPPPRSSCPVSARATDDRLAPGGTLVAPPMSPGRCDRHPEPDLVQRHDLRPVRRPRRAQGEGQGQGRARPDARGVRPPSQIPARRAQQDPRHQLRSRPGRVLPLPGHQLVRPHLRANSARSSSSRRRSPRFPAVRLAPTIACASATPPPTRRSRKACAASRASARR